MEFVKQRYAGWIGVIHEGYIFNGSIYLEALPVRTGQLHRNYEPTLKELDVMIAYTREHELAPKFLPFLLSHARKLGGKYV